jgi:excisionase family DNA binding protein
VAVIGTFARPKDGGWEGTIRTLSMTAKARFVPNDNRETTAAPDYRVLCGTSDLGAAWMRRAQQASTGNICPFNWTTRRWPTRFPQHYSSTMTVRPRVWFGTVGTALARTRMKNKVPDGFSPTRTNVPFMDRPTCSVAEACVAASIGKTTLYDLMERGVLKNTRVGRRRLVNVPSLLKLLSVSN